MKLFQCLLEYTESTTNYIHVCWAQGASIGHAIEHIYSDAKCRGYEKTIVREVEACQFDELPLSLAADVNEQNVWYFDERFEFEEEIQQSLPLGIIARSNEDESYYDFSDLDFGFDRFRAGNREHLSITPTDESLPSLMAGLIDLAPTINYCTMNLSTDWGVKENAVCWRRENVTKTWLKSFLHNFHQEIVANGYVSLSVGDDQFEIKLTEHKTIEVCSEHKHLIQQALFLCRRFGLEKRANSLSMNHDIEHFHYVASDALSSKQFLNELRQAGFYPVLAYSLFPGGCVND